MRPTLLNNTTCIYCGCDIDRDSRTKEHVIGRRFVPRGALENSWNLIAWSCLKCNNKKSRLEDDISAITMRGKVWAEGAQGNEIIAREDQRKSPKSYSSRTRKPVAESDESVKINFAIAGGASISMNLIAPPQIDDARVDELTKHYLIGFFYFITYDSESRRGKFPPGKIYPIKNAIKSNWGNREHIEFMRMVLPWDYRLIAPGVANSHFRVAIRKHPNSGCFSWAMEWNQHFRVAGFFGEPHHVIPFYEKIPNTSPRFDPENKSPQFHITPDIALKEKDDIMFRDPPWAKGTQPETIPHI